MNNKGAKLLLSISIAGIGVLFSLAHQNELFAALGIEAAKGGILGISEIIMGLWNSSKNGVKNENIQVIFYRTFISACNQVKGNYLKEKFIYKNPKLERLIKKLILTVEKIYNSYRESFIIDTELLKTINTSGQIIDSTLWNAIENSFIKEGADKEFCNYFRSHFQNVLHELFLKELIKPESTEGWKAFNNLMLESIQESISKSNKINQHNQKEILIKISEMQKQIGTLSYKQVSGSKAKKQFNYPDFVKPLQDQNTIILKKMDDIKDDTSFIKNQIINILRYIQNPNWFLFVKIREHPIIFSAVIIFLVLLFPCKWIDKEKKTRDELIKRYSQYVQNFDKYIERGEYKVEKFAEENVEKSKISIWVDLDHPKLPEGFLRTYLEMSRSECLKFRNETIIICNELSPHFSGRVKFMLDEAEDFANGAKTPTQFMFMTDPATGWEIITTLKLYKNGSVASKSAYVKSKSDVIKFQDLINLLNNAMKKEAEEYNKKEPVFTSSLIYKIYCYLETRFKYSPRKISFNLRDLKIHENIYSWCTSDRFLTHAVADSFFFYIFNSSKNNNVFYMHREINDPMVFSTDDIQNYISEGDTIICTAISKTFTAKGINFGFSRNGPFAYIAGFPHVIGIYVNIPGYELVKRGDNKIWYSIYN